MNLDMTQIKFLLRNNADMFCGLFFEASLYITGHVLFLVLNLVQCRVERFDGFEP